MSGCSRVTFQDGTVGLVGEVAVEDLICQVQIALVAHFLDVATVQSERSASPKWAIFAAT
jgi:hypothetical protein